MAPISPFPGSWGPHFQKTAHFAPRKAKKSGPSRLENRLLRAKNRKNEDEEIRGRENSRAAEIEPVPLMFQTMLTGLTLIPIQELTDKKQLKQFNCGIAELNSYLSFYAQKNDSLGMGKTFLALDKDGAIQGYFTLATGQVSFASLPSGYAPRLPKDPIPVLRLARLAVSKEPASAATCSPRCF